MIRTTRLLSLLCLSLTSSFIVCGEFASDEDEPVEVRESSPVRPDHSNSNKESSSDQEDTVSSSSARALSPTRRLSLQSPRDSTFTAHLTTTSIATTSSSLGTQVTPHRVSDDESKRLTAPFQQRSPRRPARNFRRQSSGSSQSSTSQSAVTQSTNEHGSPEIQRRNLGAHIVAETTLITAQGSAPVARTEPGLWDRLWSTAQPYVQCQRSITEAAIADNTFCEKYPTAPSRFAAISQTFTEYTLQAEQKSKKDYLVRMSTAFIFAQQNNIPILSDQTKAALDILRKKQREYAALEKLLTNHLAQATSQAHK